MWVSLFKRHKYLGERETLSSVSVSFCAKEATPRSPHFLHNKMLRVVFWGALPAGRGGEWPDTRCQPELCCTRCIIFLTGSASGAVPVRSGDEVSVLSQIWNMVRFWLCLKCRVLFWLSYCKSSSLSSLWSTALWYFAAVIAILITWQISSRSFDIKTRAGNLLGEISPPPFSFHTYFCLPRRTNTVSIHFVLGFNDKQQMRLQLRLGKSRVLVSFGRLPWDFSLKLNPIICPTLHISHIYWMYDHLPARWDTCFYLWHLHFQRVRSSSAKVQPLQSLSAEPVCRQNHKWGS